MVRKRARPTLLASTTQSSLNGVDGWATIATVAENGSTTLSVEGSRYTGSRVNITVRYLRLNITGGDFWNGTTARVAEVEVYAKAGTSGGTGVPIGKTIWLKANANNQYVSAWNDVNRTLQARIGAVGTWERFQVVDAGGGFVALKAMINNQYASAWNDPARTLQARIGAIGEWEKFQWIDAGGGFIALKANANGQYVAAWNDSNRTLQARTGAIGEWEKFTWGEAP